MIAGDAASRAIVFNQPHQQATSFQTPTQQSSYKDVAPDQALQEVPGVTANYYSKVAKLNSFAESMYDQYKIDVTKVNPGDPNSIEANDIFLKLWADVKHTGDRLKEGQKTGRNAEAAYYKGQIAPTANGLNNMRNNPASPFDSMQNFTALNQDPGAKVATDVAMEDYDDPVTYNQALKDVERQKQAYANQRDQYLEAGNEAQARYYQNQIDSIPTPALQDNWKKKIAQDTNNIRRINANKKPAAAKAAKAMYFDDKLDVNVSNLVSGKSGDDVVWSKPLNHKSTSGGIFGLGSSTKIKHDPGAIAKSVLGISDSLIKTYGLKDAKAVRKTAFGVGQAFSDSPDNRKSPKDDLIDAFYRFDMPNGEQKLFVKYKGMSSKGAKAEPLDMGGFEIQRRLIGNNKGKYTIKPEEQQAYIESKGGFDSGKNYIPTYKRGAVSAQSEDSDPIELGGNIDPAKLTVGQAYIVDGQQYTWDGNNFN